MFTHSAVQLGEHFYLPLSECKLYDDGEDDDDDDIHLLNWKDGGGVTLKPAQMYFYMFLCIAE